MLAGRDRLGQDVLPPTATTKRSPARATWTAGPVGSWAVKPSSMPLPLSEVTFVPALWRA